MITEGVEAYVERAARFRTELRRLEAVRRDFDANVSHELKTPIATLLTEAQVLKTDEQLKDYLASDQRVYAITTRKRLARLSFRPYVGERQGDKLLISNKKSP